MIQSQNIFELVFEILSSSVCQVKFELKIFQSNILVPRLNLVKLMINWFKKIKQFHYKRFILIMSQQNVDL